ncbi:MAG: hypothetical protein ACYS5V_17400, partial [Planctomycetota bacterium]
MKRLVLPAPRALVIAAALAAGAPAWAGDGESIVYYQLITAENRIRDVSEVPRTNRGIRRVLRISRIEGPYPGHVIHAVNRTGFGLVHTGRTVRTELRWNGKAWVAGPDAPAAPAQPTTRPSPAPPERARKDAAKVLGEKIKAARETLGVAEKAVLVAAEALTKTKGTDREAAGMLLLEQAQRARRKALRELVQLEGLLSDVAAPVAAPAVGKAVPGSIDPALPGTLGVARPIRSRRVLPYRSHVWKLPRRRGRRAYAVSMAHPEAGYYGAFYYIAYSDTTGDGTPDTLIARSPLAVGRYPGQWSRWSFATAAEDVYVGAA